MDIGVKESIDFDFFDDLPPNSAERTSPKSSTATSSKPPVHPHSTRLIPRTNGDIKAEHNKASDSSKFSAQVETFKNHTSDESSVDSDPDSERSNNSGSRDKRRSKDLASGESISASSSDDSLSSSPISSDSEQSLHLVGETATKGNSDVADRNSLELNSHSDNPDRPVNPIAKKKTHARKHYLSRAESKSNSHSSVEEKSPRKGARLAWNEAEVADSKRDRTKHHKRTQDRPISGESRINNVQVQIPKLHFESLNHSDSDMTDVSPIESPRSKSHAKPGHRKAGHALVNSAGDGQHSKLKLTHNTEKKINEDDPDRISGLDLRLLMRAMGELDKEPTGHPVNSRRVMFDPATAKNVEKGNYTFDRNQTRDIERENQRLLKEIIRQVNSSEHTKQSHRSPSSVYRLTPSAINREKEIQRIERENLAFLRRLQEVKPTKSISRDHQLKAYENTVFHGVPIAALHYRPSSRSLVSSIPDDSGFVAGERSRSTNSIASSGSTFRSVGSSRYSRPGSAKRTDSRPGSANRTSSRPAWSDRW